MLYVIAPSRNELWAFTPNFAKISILVRTIYYDLCERNHNLRTKLSIEMFEYYVTALLWARLLDIKHLNGFHNLSQKECTYRAFFTRPFYVPGMICNIFSIIGNVVTGREPGETLYLGDHSLPICVAGGKGGYHAERITAQNHNLFEEVPSLGVIGDSLMALSEIEATRSWRRPHHPFLPSDQTVASPTKLIGYYGPVMGTEEVCQFLANIAISPQNFAETVPGTRFNINIMHYVSSVIGMSAIPDMERICILEMDIVGSPLQLVEIFPSCDTWTPQNFSYDPQSISWTEVPALPKYLHYDNGQAVNEANFTGFRLYKKALLNSHANWCCVRAKGTTNAWDIPAEWIENRNDRRGYFNFCKVTYPDLSMTLVTLRYAVESSLNDYRRRKQYEYSIIKYENHLQCPRAIMAVENNYLIFM